MLAKKHPLSYLFCLACFLVGFNAKVIAENNPHILQSIPACDTCHIITPSVVPADNTRFILPQAQNFKQDGIHMCTECHSNENGHQVGISLDFSVPADLPLDNDNKITCLTCHYTHGSLHSEKPHASYSFMDVLLGSEHLHKSFLLRRNNVNGELCLTCHNSSQ